MRKLSKKLLDQLMECLSVFAHGWLRDFPSTLQEGYFLKFIRVPLTGFSGSVWEVTPYEASRGNNRRFAETPVCNRDRQRRAWCSSSNSHTVSGSLRVTLAYTDTATTRIYSITSKDTIFQDIELSIRLIGMLQSTNLP